MPTALDHIPRTQITTLENGLKSLRSSKLINSRELKDMYDAIEKHHREIRLAHVTGTPTDLLQHAKRDTKFFYILVKLLNETLIGTQHEQKDSLREVYSWYVGNKHTLASQPRFGKQKEKSKHKPVLSHGRPVSGMNKLGHVAALERELSGDLRGLAGLPQNTVDIDTMHQYQTTMPKASSPDASLRHPSSMTMSACRTEMGSPDSTATKRLSEAHQYLLPKRQTKALAHLYNPHARDYDRVEPLADPDIAATPVRFAIQTYDIKDTTRSSLGSDVRNIHMDQWEDFQEQISYGQNHLNKLQHYGRLGVAGGQRYVAHENGLAAEEFTPNVIATVTQENNHPQPPESAITQPAVPLEKQTLESFYQTTQGHYPVKLPKYPSFRLKSAPSAARQMVPPIDLISVTSPKHLKSQSMVIGSTGVDSIVQETKEPVTDGTPLDSHLADIIDPVRNKHPGHEVKLDTVVSMIDSVTDEMTFFKEKLVAEPMAGFRQPIVEVDPSERPPTAPTLGTYARPCTPLYEDDRDSQSELVAESAGGAGGSDSPRGSHSPRGSQYDDRSLRSVRSFTTEEWNTWKERFMHDTRYKWQATPAGGHAYYRKAPPRPGSRAAGQGPSGSRPKTAPQTPRERWNTTAPNEENKRPAVAATHVTTEVEQEVMDTMLAVRRLGGKNAKQRRYRFFMDYTPESRAPSRSSMTTPAMEYVSFIAPKPVAGSRASSAATRSRMGSAMDGPSSPLPADYVVIDEDNDDDEMDSLGGDLDLPAMDDLDDDLDDNFQYEGDVPLENEIPDSMELDNQPSIDENENTSDLESTANEHTSDLESTANENTCDLESTANTSDKQTDSEQDFDSVCIRSSTQGSDFDVDKQCLDSRQLINEITTLVTKKDDRVSRPVSCHSRVTFQDEHVECQAVPEVKEHGRTILKPKSILVPRHIQPPPSVGLTIVQFQGGNVEGENGTATRRAVHEPPSAPPPTSRSAQVLSKSTHWSCDPSDMTQIHHDISSTSTQHVNQVPKPSTAPASSNSSLRLQLTDMDTSIVKVPRSPHPKPRVFARAFPTKHIVDTNELEESLKVQGRSGPRSSSAQVSNRSAGVSPLRARSASHFKMIQKQEAMLRNALVVPNRTPASIPIQDALNEMPGYGPFSTEHESHAKREHNPRGYMERVGVLRKSANTVPSPPKRGKDGYLTNTLRCVALQPSTRDSALEQPTTTYYFQNARDSIYGQGETLPRHMAVTPVAATTDKVGRIYVYSGRPIPDFPIVKAPQEIQAAVVQLKQAKAAVDIQRYFRGYVSRKNYNYLLKEERHRREDQRKAALQIQNAYRAHLVRTNRIYNRPPNPEGPEWAEELRLIQEEKNQQRHAKAGAITMQNNINKAKADATLSVIGPHLEIYMPFHPKTTGPKKSVLNAAATCIQRHLRGWMIRRKFENIKRKAKQHAHSWGRFIEQYRELVRRIQMRYGINRPQVPFCFQQVSDFMDLKKKYESKFFKVASNGYETAFESHAFAGELELCELAEYFRECDLYPVQSDIDQAFDIVFRGQEIKKGLQRHQVMELTFHLYPPAASGVTNNRKSTWTNPIIDGEEGNKLLVRAALGRSTAYLEPTDFETAWKLVSGSIRNRRKEEKEQKASVADADVRAKLEALKLKRTPALKEEDDTSTVTSDKQETVSTVSSKEKRVKFAETVGEQPDPTHEEQPNLTHE